jgi:hypothetical protein
MPSFIEDYNRRFGKLPRDRHDAHRPVREDEELDLTFTWHEARKVTSNLTLQYERKIYMLADNSENRRLIGKYIQAQRDDRVVNKPSTAHRSDGSKVPRKKVHGTRSQRELGYDDLHAAIHQLSTSKISIDEVA